MEVVDRVIRGSASVPRVPAQALALPADALVASVGRGALDHCLAPLRTAETAGAARSTVLDAIDSRARVLRAEVT